MERDKQVWKVARDLVKQHGGKAPQVAHERAKAGFHKGDYPSGVVWERVEEAAKELVSEM